MASTFRIVVWSNDPSFIALASDLARTGRCSATRVDALPELALFCRDNVAELAGIAVDFRSLPAFAKDPGKVATSLMEVCADYPGIPALVILGATEDDAHLSQSGSNPATVKTVVVTPAMELAGAVSDQFKLFFDCAAQLEEKASLEDAFIDESTALLDEIEPMLLDLEQNPGETACLDVVFRNVHTIKGSSGFFDNNPVPAFLHRFEDVLARMKSGKLNVTAQGITAMLKGLDVTRQMLNSMRDKTPWHGSVDEALKLFDFSDASDAAPAPSTSADDASPVVTTDESVVAPAKDIDESKVENKPREFIQVPVPLLDEFMELSGESTVIRNMVNKLVRAIEKETPGNRNVALLGELLDEMHKINSSVQGRLTELRKIPAGKIVKALPRAVRDLSQSLGKQIDFDLEGDNIRLDTAVAQVLGESLVHLVRNAVDHGVESPEARTSAGKPARGRLSVALHEAGDEILAVVADDGGGIDPEKIRNKIIAQKMFSSSEVATFTDARLFSMIFEPGFSTAAKVTGISGRGVGLDMVKSSVEKLRGRIDIASDLGKGTTFTMHLPIPKSVLIVSSLLVQAETKPFAVPQDRIVRLIRTADAVQQKMIRKVEGGVVLDFHGELIPVIDLGSSLGLRSGIPSFGDDLSDLASFVVIQAESGIYAMLVDAILDSEEIVMKRVGAQLEGRKAFAGATFMGDGTVGLILNVDGLAEISGVQLRDSDLRKDQVQHSAKARTDVLLVDVEAPGDFGLPMDSVFRLEDFDPDRVKSSIDRSIVVYRDQPMPLIDMATILKAGASGGITMQPIDLSVRERVFVMVFRTLAGHFFGCVVDRIKDFITVEGELSTTNRSYECIKGSVVIDNRVVSVIDPATVVGVASRIFDQVASIGTVNFSGTGKISGELKSA